MIRNLFIFGGPSGSGKTYIANMLMKNHPDRYNKMLQCTTRSMRENEKEGDPYLFIKDVEEWEKISNNLIFTTVTDHGSYGTFSNNLDLTKDQIVIADVNALKLLANKESLTYQRCYELFDSIYIIGFDYDPEKENNKDRMKGRENRDNSLYLKFNQYADLVFYNDADCYLSDRLANMQLSNFYKVTQLDNKYKYTPVEVSRRLKEQFNK